MKISREFSPTLRSVAANERASTRRQRERGQRCGICDFYLGGPAWAGMRTRFCKDCEPRPHRVLLNFVRRESTYLVHFLAEDCRTRISRFYRLPDKEALRGLVMRTKPSDEALASLLHALETWGQGSQFLQLTAEQYSALVGRRSVN